MATVSYVLNNGPRPVADETRERVLDAIRRLDYHPNAMARGLNRGQMHTVGVLFGNVDQAVITNTYAAAVVEGVLAASAEAHYSVTLFTSRWEDAGRSAFRDRRTDGVLVVAPLSVSDVVSGLAALGSPLVVVSAPSGVTGVPYVDIDNLAGGRLAGEHLLALGHTRVAFLGGTEQHADVPIRREGFLQAMAAGGVSIPPQYLPEGSYDIPKAHRIARALLTLPDRPTAVFAGNDTVAVYLMEAARELGLRVPQDLSLVGFDDLPAATLISPALTTVRQPLREMGVLATRLLIGRINERMLSVGSPASGADHIADDGPPLAHIFSPELVVRRSTAPPPAS